MAAVTRGKELVSGGIQMHHRDKTVSNLTSDEMLVIIEPHGNVLTLAPGESIEIVAKGLQAGEIELFAEDAQKICVYVWPTSTSVVYQKGEVIRDYAFPVPRVPPGMTTRTFLDTMLGRQRDEPDK